MHISHARFGKPYLWLHSASGVTLSVLFFGLFMIAERILVGSQTPWTFASAVVGVVFGILMAVVYGMAGFYHRDSAARLGPFLGKCTVLLVMGLPVAHAALTLLPSSVHVESPVLGMLSLSFVCLSGAALFRPSSMGGRLSDMVAHRVLVLGTGSQAALVHGALLEGARTGMQCVGFLPTPGSSEQLIPAHQVLNDPLSLERAVQQFKVNEVVVAVQQQRGGVLPIQELLSCRLRGVLVSDAAGFLERVRGELPVDALKASWLIYGDGFRHGMMRRFVKRTFDIVASLLLLVLTAPVMLLAAVAIVLEGGGPVIFRQERVGLNGKTFTLLKFRSMRVDAEKDGAPQWATANDPRVTRIGAFIRKVRIDELPQLFNVLRGEMSFVGPRPERPYFVEQLSAQIQFYGARHSVKPGITGWAQVRFTYGASL
ncbi:MAG: TIGR03013 family PEP-CTERM/XrtA system glycosyltransferase, partial [Burkholderiales bacterium]|nr:TIGR03013 family PEP-CTERM/XrtA system glycosyltransferase [Burkholderiales bacterium]